MLSSVTSALRRPGTVQPHGQRRRPLLAIPDDGATTMNEHSYLACSPTLTERAITTVEACAWPCVT
jgi:hypothetical protein